MECVVVVILGVLITALLAIVGNFVGKLLGDLIWKWINSR